MKVRLGEIATLITKGTTPTSLGYRFTDKGVNFIKVESISENGNFIHDKFAHISNECDLALKRSQLKENDILFSIAGAIGRTAIVDKEILPANTNQALAIIRLKQDRVFYPYVKYMLQSGNIRAQIEIKKQGVAQLNLSLKDISELEVNLPSIAEQKAIFELFNKVDVIIENRKKQLEKLDLLIKSQFIDMFGDARSNPKSWAVKKGTSLFKFSSGKFLSEENRKKNGIPVYGGNGIAWYTDKPLISHPTIVIGRVGAYCGNIRKVDEPIWITDNAIFIKEFYTDDLNLTYLNALMQDMSFAQYADYSGQPKITQKPLESIKYMLPPIELQNQFARFVEQTDKSKNVYELEVAA